MANQVERVEVLADFLAQGFEHSPSAANSSMTACLRAVAFQTEEIVQAGEPMPDRLLGVIAQALRNELAVFVEVFDPLGSDVDGAFP